MSSGRMEKAPRLAKGGTSSSRKHRFESFNQRIAKLNIDPIRRPRPIDLETNDLAPTTSYLKAGLEKWKALNLSENFSKFVHEAVPLCHNLPQILHYQQEIMVILGDYIEKRDSLSLEPLLDLLGRFSHDLGIRFQCYFSEAVTLVASLASTHPDVQVIEWSFTCLAWLFKYLSRPLVLDLRPLFHIMAPLLGREPQKVHTTKFAAEAMSFLLRRAALIFHKNQMPLNLIVDWIFEDLDSMKGPTSSCHLYQHGLMTLFIESMKGIDRRLHSCAPCIYRCLLERILEKFVRQPTKTEAILSGVTTSLVHYTDAVTLLPILEVIFDSIERQAGVSNNHIRLHGGLIFIVTTVRKASRINDWQPIVDALMSLLESCKGSTDETVFPVFNAAAVVISACPLDIIVPRIRPIMSTIRCDQNAKHFLLFCNFFCELNQERFQNLLLPYFSKFIVSHWDKDELKLLLSLPKVIGEIGGKKPVCPDAWQQHIIKAFEFDDHSVFHFSAYLESFRLMSIPPLTNVRVTTALGGIIQRRIHSASGDDSTALFSLGQGLKFFLINSKDLCPWRPETFPLIFNLGGQYGTLPPYLEAVLLSVKGNHFDRAVIIVDPLIDVLVENLHSSSHVLRELSLEIMKALLEKDSQQEIEIITTALAIENSRLDLQSARTISMHIRRLSSLYKPASSQAWIQKAIPHYCFGLLTFRLSQVCDDAILALKEICDTREGEEVVSDLAFRWLNEPYRVAVLDPSSKPKQIQNCMTEFQCSNLTEVENLLETVISRMKDPPECIQKSFDRSHQLLTRKVTSAPNLALRVFSGLPHIAEKRSRQLVPKFLDWAMNVMQEGVIESLEDSEALAEQESLKPQDQKAMLGLFGLFHNPRVLYRSSDVFDALRNQLTNGDVEVQRSALKAIFTWKVQGIQPYQENLMNLLDDSRFREEISTFVHDVNAIQGEHRQVLIPILLRILYGKMISGTGAGGMRRGQAVKRKAVLEALSRLGDGDLHEFVQLILGPLRNLDILKDLCLTDERVRFSKFNTRKQVGFINMMKDMHETLGNQLAPFAKELTEALLFCLIRATRRLSALSNSEDVEVSQTSLLKDVRQIGMQCLTLMFRHYPVNDLKPYMPTIVGDLVSPRLERFPIETAQSVSGLLKLFSTWASSRDTITFLTDYESSLISSVASCLEVPSAQEEVKLYILEEIFKPIVNLCKASTDVNAQHENTSQQRRITQQVLGPNMDIILERVGSLLKKSPSKELLGSAIQFVSLLAPLVESSSQVGNLVKISTFLLEQPFHRVNPQCKSDLLKTLQHLVPMVDLLSLSDLQDRIFRTVSSLFGYFKDRTSRLVLSQVLLVLAEKDPELRDTANLCFSLNSFSVEKLDEPNFDERLSAFNAINEVKYQEFSAKQWQPLLYNMLYYIKDEEELAIRSNASFALRRFVETKKYGIVDDDTSFLVKVVLLPALRSGAFESSELVRGEYLGVMAHLVLHNPDWEEINDMFVLLVNEDEEASFFSNVLHIQQHRRLRALRRLGMEAHQSGLRSANVAHFFVPLIEHFVFNKAEDESAHNLAAETMLTIGALASCLEWSQFRALFGRYSGYIVSKPDLGKTVIKLLGIITDTLRKGAEANSFKIEKIERDIREIDIASPEVSPSSRQSKLSTTIPRQEKLTEDLTKNLLPLLLKYLHDKDESTVSLRVPIAVATVKLIILLQPDQRKDFLPAVLTDVCHILRSRSQESRDLTRKTLVEISTLIGPHCFGFVLKELRSALARGYQLHVLSFTVHAILVATVPIFKPGDLDYCLPQVVSVIMDDIFGPTGLEKDAEEYVSKMKEVKSSKSYDSMELVSKNASVENFVHLIRPLQTLLEEKLDLRMVKKIDELLRRVTVGLLRNKASQDRQVLVFCYEIIQDVYKSGDGSKDKTPRENLRNQRFLLNSQGANKPGTRGSTSYRYKLTRFSLDVVRCVLKKHDSLKIPANICGFIPIMGDALVGSNEEVQISALRLLTAIIKVPLKELDENASIYIAECVKIIKAQVSTNSELAKAALKLVSTVLRERSAIEFKEIDLAYLLQRLIPDLEEPDRQGVVFSFIKAIIARKVLIAEVYEILDSVAAIMVTNQTKDVRDSARSVYFQFLMEYPQGKTFFSKQLAFLVRNLDYKHQEGRQSVMEAIHLLFLKVGDDMVQTIVDAFMVPLVMVIVNDKYSACREMASALLKTSLERADPKRTLSFLMLLRNWLAQLEKPLLVRAALQLYNLYFDVDPKKGEKELSFLHLRIARILKFNIANDASADWELLYFALQSVSKIAQLYPNSTFVPNFGPLWASVRHTLSFPHMWVKLSAAKLLGTFYADFAKENANAQELELPLQGSGGLLLKGDEIVEATRSLLALLKTPGVNEELANQSVRNLIFLGRIMGKTSLVWKQAVQHPEIGNPDDSEDFNDNEDIDEDEVSHDPRGKSALAFVLERTSALIRRGPQTTKSASLIPLKASLLLLTALCTDLPLPVLRPHLTTILLPLHNLADPTIAVPFSTDESFTTTYQALAVNGSETMAQLQKRMGTTEYVRVLATVREGVRQRREGRRIKRRIGAVLEPERREAEKRRKGERKRERRKEKSGEEKGRRRGW